MKFVLKLNLIFFYVNRICLYFFMVVEYMWVSKKKIGGFYMY